MIIIDAKTDFSFMRGFGTPKQWLERCKETGATALGVADYCSTWGHAPFRDEFKGSGVKLLYGVTVPVVSMLDKDPRHSLVTLIAKRSLEELYHLMTLAQAQTYYRARLTWRQVHDIQDCHVIVNNILPTHMVAASREGFWLGMSPDMPAHMNGLGLKRVLACAPVYPSPAQRRGFELVRAVSDGQRIGEGDASGFHMFRNRGEANSVFGYNAEPEWFENTLSIASDCEAEIPKGRTIAMTGDLRAMALVGAERLGLVRLRLHENGGLEWEDQRYAERLDRELAVIKEKNFEDYFFFVTDLVQWARARMFVGPGRGSSSGSLLCYLLGITTVDPLKFGTMFERFIDITRSDLPDIDTDFPDVRREEVFTYLKEKYGAERVARLGTITEFGGKSALNDTARANGIPFDVSREIGKYTEGGVQGKTFSPAWVFENVAEVAPLLEKHPAMRLACEIDGHVRNHGVHASGVIVTDEPVERYGVVDRAGVVSLDMKTAEKLGLVKMDALGLRTLSVIQETCDLAKIDPNILYDLNWADREVYDRIFNADRVTGIFQFEGHAVRSLLRAVKVEAFDDLCALTSLARPGPLIGGAAGSWVKARNGEVEGRKLHPSLESTYGVICYQEQAMAIVRDLAGFDIVQVNGFRRAVAKKTVDILQAMRGDFVKGAAAYFLQDRKTGELSPTEYEIEKAEALWEELCEFGSYAFNLAHAVAYCMISFMTAWLKLKYPLEFAVAQLRNAADDEQAKNLLRELAEEGYAYVPFDPEKSQASWAIIDGKLYGGFDSVRGVGAATAKKLLAKREEGGPEWLDTLTEAQRTRLTKPQNTPWHSLTYFRDTYQRLYDDPNSWRSPGIAKGIKGAVVRIKDIPEVKGGYAFLAKITKKTIRDLNEPSRLSKRDGIKFDKNSFFVNLTFEDDTGELQGTINRYKASDFSWLTDGETDGKDYFIRGNIIEDGKRWLFVDNIVELKHAIDEK